MTPPVAEVSDGATPFETRVDTCRREAAERTQRHICGLKQP